ncbi:MAG: hypothetical protein LPK79_14555 [Bacteroidota bacterium]|mgnify:CR=1 FL=1|nr:hypothetical protein [Bacteroidota bacterium]
MDRSLDLLFQRVNEAYEESDIKARFPQESWNYSITSTYLKRNVPLILGFNWGAEKGVRYEPQSLNEIPTVGFGELKEEELGSLRRTLPYFKEYFPEGLKSVQSNYVFFRSKTEGQISKEDIELRSQPLMDDLLSYLSPSMIISFSSRLRDLIMKRASSEVRIMPKENFTRVPLVIKTKVQLGAEDKQIPFVYIPHPNSRVPKEYREKAWEFAFS